MATSIAKLAIVMTADTAATQLGFRNAQDAMHRFGIDLTETGKRLHNTFHSSQSGAMGLEGIIGKLSARFLSVGAAIMATKRGLGFIMELSERSDEAARSLYDAAKAYDEMLVKVHGSPLHGGMAIGMQRPITASDTTESIKTLAARGLGPLRDELWAILVEGPTGGRGGAFFTAMRVSADLEKNRIQSIKDATKAKEEEGKADAKALKEFYEARAKKTEEGNADVLKWGDEMRAAGDKARESVLTPLEAAAAAMRELKDLAATGFISDDTFGRGASKVREDLAESIRSAIKLKDIAKYQPIAGAERGSAAAFSAIQSNNANFARMAETAKQQLAVEKQIKEAIDKLDETTREKKPIVIPKVNL